MKRPFIIIFLVLFIDQLTKFLVKTNMHLGEEFSVLGDWFIIHFTENNGMAFGMEFEGNYGKLFLSVFRIIAVGGIAYYLYWLVKEKMPKGLVASISLVFAGAVGNIIDSVFYGKIFNDSFGQVASFMPAEGGYAGLLHGKVVDMLYFPLVEGYFPEWFPIWGGEHFLFFRPVFNIADSAITVGIALIVIFQKRWYTIEKEKEENLPAGKVGKNHEEVDNSQKEWEKEKIEDTEIKKEEKAIVPPKQSENKSTEESKSNDSKPKDKLSPPENTTSNNSGME